MNLPRNVRIPQFACLVLFLIPRTVLAQLGAPPPSTPPPGLVAEIPFDHKQNWVVLDVKIGKDFDAAAYAPTLHFLLDTGASVSVLTKEALNANKLALDYALTETGKTRAEGAGDSGGVTSNQSARAAIQAGMLHVVAPLAIFPLGDYFRRLGIDGILGNDIIRSFVTEIDYSARVVRFYNPAGFQPPSPQAKFTAVPLGFRDADDLPCVEADITPFGFSSTRALMTLDTGDDRCVTLYAPYVERQKWQDSLPRTVPANYSGAGGGGSGVAGRLRSVSFADSTLALPPVVFSTSKRGAFASAEADGQFGGMLLERFTLIIDYGHRILYARPNPSITTRFLRAQYLGMYVLPPVTTDGGYKVDVVEAGSPADQAGVRAGQILYKIDDKSVVTMGYEALTTILQYGRSAHVYEIGRPNETAAARRQVSITGIDY